MKIDVSKIEGYETMSAEEKIAALEAYESDEGTTDEKLKKAFAKASSDVARLKKELEAKQTEQERAESERKEKEEEMLNELAELRKEKAISTNKANFIGAGYSEALAESSAKAIVDGDYNKIFSDLKAFIDENNKKIKENALNQQPGLSSGKIPNPQDEQEKYFKKLREIALNAR